jgi:hypothetical protein
MTSPTVLAIASSICGGLEPQIKRGDPVSLAFLTDEAPAFRHIFPLTWRVSLIVIDLFRWPLQVWPYQEVIAAAVESFSGEGRRFDYSRSACQQLKERIVELRGVPNRLEALVVVDHELTELDCLNICLSQRQS